MNLAPRRGRLESVNECRQCSIAVSQRGLRQRVQEDDVAAESQASQRGAGGRHHGVPQLHGQHPEVAYALHPGILHGRRWGHTD